MMMIFPHVLYSLDTCGEFAPRSWGHHGPCGPVARGGTRGTIRANWGFPPKHPKNTSRGSQLEILHLEDPCALKPRARIEPRVTGTMKCIWPCYRARYYDPGRGRFVSEDPIGRNGGLNAYVYVGSSPIVYIDPLGLSRIPYTQMAKMVAANSGGGFSNELILCIAWQESGHDPASRHGSKTETGLMGVSRGAVNDPGMRARYDYYRDVGDNSEANIAAGRAYLRLRVDRAGGDLKEGMKGYGTGETYPVEMILKCEKCLKQLPPDVSSGKCPSSNGAAGPQDCLNMIHK